MPRKKRKTNRRGNGEGGIHQRKDGRWCGQVTIGYDEQGKQLRKTFYGSKREDVARKVTDAANQAFNGMLTVTVTGEKPTVTELISNYLWTYKRLTVSDVTFNWYINTVKSYIFPTFGFIKACELTSEAVQKLINKMHFEDKLAVRTIKGVRNILNQAYTHAIETKQLVVNPVTATKLPIRSRVKEEDKEYEKAIPVDARAKILKATEKDLCMKTAITVLMLTGMRVGEWLALTWGHVDFKNSIITVEQAITKTSEYDDEGKLVAVKTVVGDTKTQCSTRKMKVSDAVMDVLKEWKKALPTHVRKSVTHDVLASKCFVFPNDLGEMRTYNGFRCTYRRFMDKNNLGHYTLHSLRHTFATMLLEKEVNPRVVQKLLGHRDIETTLGIYSHVLPEVFDGVAHVIGKLHTDMTTTGTEKVPQTLETQSVA